MHAPAARPLPQDRRRQLQGLRPPWPPLLAAEEQQRGLTYYGSGSRVRAFAQKLLDGEPVTVVALGGSITMGSGVPSPELCYTSRFFQALNASFPHRQGPAASGGWCGRSRALFNAHQHLTQPA